MKSMLRKWMLAFCLVAMAGNAFAQQRCFCEVKAIEKDLSGKIIFDFGTQTTYNVWGQLNGQLKLVDENGEEINFNSMVGAANYLAQKGWFFQQAYSSTCEEKSVVHWIFCKDAESLEKAKEGIVTKEEYQKSTKR